MKTPADNAWGPSQAAELYNIPHWSDGYFGVGDDGQLRALPAGPGNVGGVGLYDLATELRAMGLAPPVLVRFTDILHHRLDALAGAFGSAMAARGYEGTYTAVYPIKVNQQARVVSEVLHHGRGRVGLEAGSKPELMAVLGLASDDNPTVICNGYKDREYIRLALIGRRLGHDTCIVIEKPSELPIVVAAARDLGIEPALGIRLRLASIGKGKWQNSGGERSKFGLTAREVLEAIDTLRQAGLLEHLRLMHFHLGSQVANIRDIQTGLREAARYYAELRRLGVPITRVDVGGGLGVDYEGTARRSFCSMNYSIQEYANNVVQALGEMCETHDLPHPDIITEAGRAMTAHHAMLITEVTDTAVLSDPGELAPPAADEPFILDALRRGLEGLSRRNAVETFHDSVHWLREAQDGFSHGAISLAERAAAEHLYAIACLRIRGLLDASSRGHREVLDTLNESLSDKYICNFSLFQSLPDAWAIDQIFPVVPLHRLNERPARQGVIHDLTCDSDGQLHQYVGPDGVESNLPLHAVAAGQPYLLGIFMVGAYQEILGDMHNLFGDTHSVNVTLTGDGAYRLSEPLHGDKVSSVLNYVHFSAAELLDNYRHQAARAGLSGAEAEGHLAELAHGLEGYTYLEE
ncbi:MAG: biosynthetic arginine decarboxylase [Gammaproteobacteria bacterium]|nr:biosynthetic arginine decarboxylase [Gammaproteobacteria bacterium]